MLSLSRKEAGRPLSPEQWGVTQGVCWLGTSGRISGQMLLKTLPSRFVICPMLLLSILGSNRAYISLGLLQRMVTRSAPTFCSVYVASKYRYISIKGRACNFFVKIKAMCVTFLFYICYSTKRGGPPSAFRKRLGLELVQCSG